ncbi:uncharacterized protein LOC106636785 [Copidosoma floridanum]|uniref:uncharacterized protein LOC106636785 n=1 Tax=Copidosoma floridanum TaxID=29053 RepID=UPI0006C99AAB|nr:uncharacterized protein LOC106636785 [Copidosoma floridanum]
MSGRYLILLLIKTGGLYLLGNSLNQAQRALDAVHRRMRSDMTLRSHYTAFMSKYLTLGQMRSIAPEKIKTCYRQINCIPHHVIWQGSDSGKRLSVVLNASTLTLTGNSLNDALYSGPKLQNDISSVITRWR